MAKMVLIGILAVAVLAGLWLVSLNNQLMALHENIGASWAQVDTVLQRRYDLVPNLVNTVKGYAAHEKDLFAQIAQYRSQWAAARTPTDRAQAAAPLESALGRLIAIAESYPDLKASQNFRDLQFELAGTENRIAVERQRYNDAVRAFNTRVRQFPGSVVAGVRGLAPVSSYFEAAPPAKEVPKVQF